MASEFCTSCGAPLTPGSKFCTACGTTVAPTQQAPTPPPAQPQYQQPQYQQPQYQQPAPPAAPVYQQPPVYPTTAAADPREAVLKTGAYVGMFILSAIPIVGFILMIVWAVSDTVNRNKRNYARAYWVLMLISVCLSILITIIIAIVAAIAGASFADYIGGYTF